MLMRLIIAQVDDEDNCRQIRRRAVGNGVAKHFWLLSPFQFGI